MPCGSQQEGVADLGSGLLVTRVSNGQGVTLALRIKTGAECVLHGGLSRRVGAPGRPPPIPGWPREPTPAEGAAVRTPFVVNDKGEREVRLHLEQSAPWKALAFV